MTLDHRIAYIALSMITPRLEFKSSWSWNQNQTIVFCVTSIALSLVIHGAKLLGLTTRSLIVSPSRTYPIGFGFGLLCCHTVSDPITTEMHTSGVQ